MIFVHFVQRKPLNSIEIKWGFVEPRAYQMHTIFYCKPLANALQKVMLVAKAFYLFLNRIRKTKRDERTQIQRPHLFQQYSKMNRSQKGLEGTGEWYVLRTMLPDLSESTVLDLGCGFGWHCRYVMENGARSVIGVDIADRMLEKARRINDMEGIQYERSAQFKIVEVNPCPMNKC